MLWDLFCRVIDNHGDVGVCWRLAADLAARGEPVRLWIDDASALRWMAPNGATGVTVLPWPAGDAPPGCGDAVIEAFGCELPESVLRQMAAAARPPVWINLEYLSAEPFVERAHRLPSPQSVGPGAGLRKWFFYPGFTPRTGGLIRERDLADRQRAFDATTWLQAQGLARRDDEQIVSLFCYDQPALPALLEQLSQRPSLLLAATGAATRQVGALLGPALQRGPLRAVALPALTQSGYDELLWAADLNFVRGEDSFVRAQWAGKPFVWQAYAQHDGAHLAKVEAFLDRCLACAEPTFATGLRALWRAWNASAPAASLALPASAAWGPHGQRWRASLLAQPDLSHQLLGFVAERR